MANIQEDKFDVSDLISVGTKKVYNQLKDVNSNLVNRIMIEPDEEDPLITENNGRVMTPTNQVLNELLSPV